MHLALAAALLAALASARPFAFQEETARPPGPRVLDPSVWTQPGAPVPTLRLHTVHGAGPVDLAELVRTAAPGARPKRTLLIRFASW
ncbi:MAG: hypothetical protein AAFP86_18325 [Planctomycetota bacterium]